MTDHGRLLAATHNHARDRREDDSSGGRDGRHEQVFWEEVNGSDYSGDFIAGQARSHKKCNAGAVGAGLSCGWGCGSPNGNQNNQRYSR